MGQLGFFDADKRLQALSARGDPLEAIDHLVPWESFRAEIEAVVLTPDESKKQRWPEAVRCDPDVQDAGSTSAQQSVGRAGGISGARPAVVLALSGARDAPTLLRVTCNTLLHVTRLAVSPVAPQEPRAGGPRI